MEKQNPFKSGCVSITSEPNWQINILEYGTKLAIVTPKPQTMRNRITEILTADLHQIIFLDTPNVLTSKYS